MNGDFKDFMIGDLRIKVPVIQGGMGVRVSSSRLAAAVSNEGALGIIAAVGLGEECGIKSGGYRERSRIALAEAIRETRKNTQGPFGVNIMCALTNYEELVRTAAEESVDVIISGAGLPLKLPSMVPNHKTKLIPIVSSARAARLICDVWRRRYDRLPDAMVVEGPMAGGHLGYSREELADPENFSLERILVEVLAVAASYHPGGPAIPVIAAGGVFDGEDIARMIRLGAGAVQMATRFVCTHECDAALAYKQAFLSARPEDIIIIQSPVGLPGRVVRNAFVERILRGERMDFECAYHCLLTCDPKKVNYCIAKALNRASLGEMDHGFAMCGSNAHRIRGIVSVKELIAELVDGARSSLKEACLPAAA